MFMQSATVSSLMATHIVASAFRAVAACALPRSLLPLLRRPRPCRLRPTSVAPSPSPSSTPLSPGVGLRHPCRLLRHPRHCRLRATSVAPSPPPSSAFHVQLALVKIRYVCPDLSLSRPCPSIASSGTANAPQNRQRRLCPLIPDLHHPPHHRRHAAFRVSAYRRPPLAAFRRRLHSPHRHLRRRLPPSIADLSLVLQPFCP
ncbi:hypothetical protein AXF42_Ash010472 [Apostasia shenzhenica]|uniref:Uncharacterized protein n=1 Tax=Apostasia shenzhenica TaxID=1088818 RepID=A0A2I0BE33_9ASPA|nr:hypothetical protein AXF42_Ash010472 [Apostasia shenzhenica]